MIDFDHGYDCDIDRGLGPSLYLDNGPPRIPNQLLSLRSFVVDLNQYQDIDYLTQSRTGPVDATVVVGKEYIQMSLHAAALGHIQIHHPGHGC